MQTSKKEVVLREIFISEQEKTKHFCKHRKDTDDRKKSKIQETSEHIEANSCKRHEREKQSGFKRTFGKEKEQPRIFRLPLFKLLASSVIMQNFVMLSLDVKLVYRRKIN